MTSIRPRPATLTDIARKVGVSTATVSYVLNDAPAGRRIPEATRTRVRSVADELGYVPHASARSLRKGTTDLLLHVQADIVQGPLAADFVHGLTQSVRGLGYTLVQYGAERHRGVKAARSWAGMRPAAVIAPRDRLTEAGTDVLRKAGIHVFAVGVAPEESAGTGVSTLNMDHRGLGHTAGRHLVERGYQDIAALVPRTQLLARMGNERLTGLKEVAEDQGAAVRPAEMDWTPDSAADVVAGWLEDGLPDAVFGYNDEFSGLLLGALLDAGVRVPERVALVGADDTMVCRMLRPELTTVRMECQGHDEVARSIVGAVQEDTQVHLSPWSPVLVRRQT
ncbi:LacI family DNA-binding transcriptional regulator [Nocardiopsis sp. HNM0947]|uniref:LacI family DNA-binding transcriptional regulator n=1 Tax=Nocardiopsis coralli TaxID=2772213 RepID=A0ABR9P6J2_9ACTN|nr:LacI family DNA-binding transcriptional regulator [Nocardiopsis coralli]MBE2999434.1 LacI family DNA-binding transcriptional regulator [Nocardiopsis coralli]